MSSVNHTSSLRERVGPTPVWTLVAATYALLFVAVAIATNDGQVNLSALLVGAVISAAASAALLKLTSGSRIVGNAAVILAALAGVVVALVV